MYTVLKQLDVINSWQNFHFWAEFPFKLGMTELVKILKKKKKSDLTCSFYIFSAQ